MATTKKSPRTITGEQIRDLMAACPSARNDPRVRVMTDLANEHRTYTEKLEWLARKLQEEVQRNGEWGLDGVSETVMQTSLIPDVANHAAKIRALLHVLETTCRAADDPEATAVDALIRTLDRSLETPGAEIETL
ncbi:MAG: hypothetical protein ACE15D_16395 [Candidatus Eisenbacteria bacterium]|nr:hypothetical protein [Candidatus Eisenbacteria bacterium]